MTGWPWPLDAVQGWFEALWDNVLEAPYNAVKQLWSWVQESADWIVSSIEGFADWIVTKIEYSVANSIAAVSDGVRTVLGAVEDSVRWLSSAVADMVSGLRDAVEEWFEGLGRAVSDAWSSLASLVEGAAERVIGEFSSVLEWAYGNLSRFIGDVKGRVESGFEDVSGWVKSSADELWRSVNSGLSNLQVYVGDAVSGLWDSLTGLAGDILSGVVSSLGEGLSWFFDWLMKKLGWIAEMVSGAVDFVVDKVSPTFNRLVSGLMDTLTSSMTSASPPPEIKRAAEVFTELNWQRQVEVIDSIYHSPPSPEDAERAAKAVLMGALTAGGAAMVAAIAADQAHPAKNIGFRPTVREIVYWSGIPAVTASIATLPTAIGLLEPLRHSLNERWTPAIPSSSDLVRFAVREVFDPQRRQALVAMYPGGEYESLMAKLGYRREYAEMYWAAHWVLPSITQLNTMLFRGVIDRETWKRYVVYNDYIPEAVDWLEQIIYEPYTRVDIRRMWSLGVVDDEEVYRNYRALGYDHEHAEKMTLWTRVYERLPDLEAMYRNGWISAEEMAQELVRLGLSAERVDWLMKTIVPKNQPQRLSEERDLTKTDILRLYRIGQLTDSQALEMLTSIGYDETEASYLLVLEKDRLDVELRDLSTSQILKAYRYEVFTRDEAYNRLVEAGWNADAAETLLKLEDIKLEDSKVERMRERDLTRMDVIKAVQRGFMDVQTGHDYLAYLGYSEWEINIIFKLEGISWPTGS